MRIERTTQRRSLWLLLFFLCIINSFPLLHQNSSVINPLDLDTQEIRFEIRYVESDPISQGQGSDRSNCNTEIGLHRNDWGESQRRTGEPPCNRNPAVCDTSRLLRNPARGSTQRQHYVTWRTPRTTCGRTCGAVGEETPLKQTSISRDKLHRRYKSERKKERSNSVEGDLHARNNNTQHRNSSVDSIEQEEGGHGEHLYQKKKGKKITRSGERGRRKGENLHKIQQKGEHDGSLHQKHKVAN